MIDEFRVEFDMEQNMCSVCKKSSPEYYEHKLQIRFKFFEEDEIMNLKEKVVDLLMKNFNSINKIDESDGGFEVYFRDHGQMNKLSTLFQRNWLVLEKRSSKIMGKDNLTSKSLFRYTQIINLLNISVRDEVMVKGEEYYIKAINKGDTLVLRGLKDGKKTIVNYNMVEDYFKILKKAKKKDYVEK